MITSNKVRVWQKTKIKSYVRQPEATKDFWRFDMGEHSFALSPNVAKILKKLKMEDLKQRPDISCQAVKKAAAKFWHVNSENVSVSNGSDQIICRIPRIFMNPGDTSIVINPTFFLFANAVIRAGGKVAAVQTKIKDDFKFTDGIIDALIKLAKQKQAKIVWLCNPNNPTGEVISLTQIERITKKTNTLVVVDEVFFEISDLAKKESAVNLIDTTKNLIVLKSLSKAHGLMGVRVGFGIANRKIINLLENWRLPFSVSRIAQKIAVSLLNDQEHLKKVKLKTIKERKLLLENIKRVKNLRLGGDSKTNIFLLKHKSKDLFKELIKHKILAADFRKATGITGQRFVRLTIKDRKENKILFGALKKI